MASWQPKPISSNRHNSNNRAMTTTTTTTKSTTNNLFAFLLFNIFILLLMNNEHSVKFGERIQIVRMEPKYQIPIDIFILLVVVRKIPISIECARLPMFVRCFVFVQMITSLNTLWWTNDRLEYFWFMPCIANDFWLFNSLKLKSQSVLGSIRIWNFRFICLLKCVFVEKSIFRQKI